MSDFDYNQYGSNSLSEEDRQILITAASSGHSNEVHGSLSARRAISSALREIDRLRAENERLQDAYDELRFDGLE